MNRQIAMVITGFVTALAVIGGTVAAAQNGVLSTSTTTIQANGDINVPKVSDQATTGKLSSTSNVEIITETQVMPVQIVTHTVVVDNSSREAALIARLNNAYAVMNNRDATYRTKLQNAYNKLAEAQAAADAAAAQANIAVDSAPAPDAAPAPAPEVAPVAEPQPVVAEPAQAPQQEHHSEDHQPETHESEDH